MLARCSAIAIKISSNDNLSSIWLLENNLFWMLHELSQLEIAWIELVPLQERFKVLTSNPQFLNFEFRFSHSNFSSNYFWISNRLKDLEMTMNTPMAPSLSEIALNNFKNDMNSLPVELPALNRAATQAWNNYLIKHIYLYYEFMQVYWMNEICCF